MPSEILKYASSIDIKIANLAIQYETYLHNKASNNQPGDDLDTNDLQAMMNAVRGTESASQD